MDDMRPVMAREVLTLAAAKNVSIGAVLDTLRRDPALLIVPPLKEEARLLALEHPWTADEIYLAWTENSDSDYVVIRGTDSAADGKWVDLEAWRAHQEVAPPEPPPRPDLVTSQTLVPWDRFELREDGAVAQVWAPAEWNPPVPGGGGGRSE